MRVLMDAGQALNRSGTGRHAQELCAALRGMPEAAEWHALCPPGFDPGPPIQRIEVPGGTARRRVAMVLRLKAWCDATGAQALYFPSSTAVTRPPRPMAVHIHDLCYRACPEWFSPARRAWYRLAVERPARQAGLVLTDSRSAALDIERFLGIPPDRIEVVPLGVSGRFQPLSGAEILEERVVSSRGRNNPRAIKKKVSNFPTRSRAPVTNRWAFIQVEIIK